ncbi:MAG: dynamin family protein [Actinomycetota bacterium]
MSSGPAADLVNPLATLAGSLTSTTLDLDLDGVAPARATRDELVHQISDYLIPRLRRLDAPLLAVMGGSTGSGKSTITNTIVGTEVTAAGVLRPTTRAPVLVCHPVDQAWFDGGELLPELARVGNDTEARGSVLRIVASDALTPGVAIIDAPDIDSVEEANRSMATQLLAAADLWLFTTTAVRYADAVPWEFLHQARDRGTALAVIINRIPPGASSEIVAHFTSMLADAALPDVTIFPVEQIDPALFEDGRLPAASVADISALLSRLAVDAEARAAVVARTLHGAISSVPGRAEEVLAAASVEQDAANDLRLALEDTYRTSRDDLAEDMSNGNLLRGEVLDRWQELIGTAEMMQAIQSRISWVRDRLTNLVLGRTTNTSQVQGEITSTLERLLIDHADRAALATVTAWRALPGGRQAIGDDRSLERSSPDLREGVAAEIRAWQDDILELVRQRGSGKRNAARALALGVNSIGIALMIVLFAQTGGITGGEIAIGAGTAGLSQTLLTAIFGEQAVRELATEARRMLLDRIGVLLETDANRFRTQLWSVVNPPEALDELRTALTAVRDAR